MYYCLLPFLPFPRTTNLTHLLFLSRSLSGSILISSTTDLSTTFSGTLWSIGVLQYGFIENPMSSSGVICMICCCLDCFKLASRWEGKVYGTKSSSINVDFDAVLVQLEFHLCDRVIPFKGVEAF